MARYYGMYTETKDPIFKIFAIIGLVCFLIIAIIFIFLFLIVLTGAIVTI